MLTEWPELFDLVPLHVLSTAQLAGAAAKPTVAAGTDLKNISFAFYQGVE